MAFSRFHRYPSNVAPVKARREQQNSLNLFSRSIYTRSKKEYPTNAIKLTATVKTALNQSAKQFNFYDCKIVFSSKNLKTHRITVVKGIWQFIFYRSTTRVIL